MSPADRRGTDDHSAGQQYQDQQTDEALGARGGGRAGSRGVGGRSGARGRGRSGRRAHEAEVIANPEKRLQETNLNNNVALRKVILGGTEGARTVTVPPHDLIDVK